METDDQIIDTFTMEVLMANPTITAVMNVYETEQDDAANMISNGDVRIYTEDQLNDLVERTCTEVAFCASEEVLLETGLNKAELYYLLKADVGRTILTKLVRVSGFSPRVAADLIASEGRDRLIPDAGKVTFDPQTELYVVEVCERE